MSARICAILLFTAAVATADPLVDARAALQRFGGKQPLHATVELERSRRSQGRFLNDHFTGKVTFEIDDDANSVRMTFGRALLDRGGDERALVEAQPLAIANTVDCAGALLRLVNRGRVVAAQRGQLTLQLPPGPNGSGEIGAGDVTDDRLTLWLGSDGVPLSAKRERRGSAGVLFIHVDTVRTETWRFAVRGDHLVALRFEDQSSVSGPGQHGEARSVWTVTTP